MRIFTAGPGGNPTPPFREAAGHNRRDAHVAAVPEAERWRRHPGFLHVRAVLAQRRSAGLGEGGGSPHGSGVHSGDPSDPP
ncbi:MAG: hypothetical protein FWD42_07715 [Solirubrobacterales bacterium]|nr:hypothetical protein [Solirubrobacterales bacterium]